ncbi:hypothetical protein TorRG33x02_328600 [Trema orientale]|uniref:Uncharacterized protein n=1 Tax=Trema orientale TaxID=63057 RepID=A0A2P5B9J9_TREOI|nr:hypothetical protein TorRG33x02_328600 [Trema orientale]
MYNGTLNIPRLRLSPTADILADGEGCGLILLLKDQFDVTETNVDFIKEMLIFNHFDNFL